MEEYAWLRRRGSTAAVRESGRTDQFLTSAMLCVGAVSVCIVSVMIAGGLAFVGLSDNAAMRTSRMDFVRNGAARGRAPAPIARGARTVEAWTALYTPSPNATIAVRHERTFRFLRNRID